MQAARQVRGYHLVPVVDHDTDGEQPWLASTYARPPAGRGARGPRPAAPGGRPPPGGVHGPGAGVRAHRRHRPPRPEARQHHAGRRRALGVDFGIARAAEATRLTRSGGSVGTPQFVSPEQGTGEELTPASDVFSLGLIAAVAADGRHPYGDGGALTVATRIANTAVRPPDLSGYDAELRPVLEAAPAADPAARPAPAELARICEELVGGGPVRDLAGWLPEPWVGAVAAREAELRQHLAEQAAAPAAPPASAPAYAPRTRTDPPAFTGNLTLWKVSG
ncbi:protein kinase [Streptomyces sp. NPDC059851]|uniref:protein kinase n=1 Tax=Streptomyces sp. NPDC059851 TaxID=3346971 RepID=UPI0036609AC4